jgi:hypothetical protein
MPTSSLGPDPVLKPPAAPDRGFGPFPSIAVDRSNGPFRGRVYIAFTDLVSGENSDVFLTSSGDQGASWTQPGSTGNVEHAASTDFFATAAVDPHSGQVGVAYYSSLVPPQDNSQINLWVASSTDGGATFTRTKVTTAPSREASYAGVIATNQFLEYIGLDARDGTLQAFWADNRGATPGTFDSNIHAYTASISTRSAGNQLQVNGDGTFTLQSDPANPAFAEVVHDGAPEWAGLWASLAGVSITTGASAADTVNIENAVPGVPVTVHLTAGGTINVCPASHQLDNIQSTLNLASYGVQTAFLNVFDDQSGANAYTLDGGLAWASVTRNNAKLSSCKLGPWNRRGAG